MLIPLGECLKKNFGAKMLNIWFQRKEKKNAFRKKLCRMFPERRSRLFSPIWHAARSRHFKDSSAATLRIFEIQFCLGWCTQVNPGILNLAFIIFELQYTYTQTLGGRKWECPAFHLFPGCYGWLQKCPYPVSETCAFCLKDVFYHFQNLSPIHRICSRRI